LTLDCSYFFKRRAYPPAPCSCRGRWAIPPRRRCAPANPAGPGWRRAAAFYVSW